MKSRYICMFLRPTTYHLRSLPLASNSDGAVLCRSRPVDCSLSRPTMSVQRKYLLTSHDGTKSSPFASGRRTAGKKFKFVPQKAAVSLTPKARTFFKALLENTSNPEIVGILLNYHQASSGEPRMVFSFDFVKADQLSAQDEGVSLEVLEDGVTPKPPDESENDGLPKLYVHHNAFMKVLGATVDVDTETMAPLLYDREGNRMDPNA